MKLERFLLLAFVGGVFLLPLAGCGESNTTVTTDVESSSIEDHERMVAEEEAKNSKEEGSGENQ